jgi:hypothetical protein
MIFQRKQVSKKRIWLNLLIAGVFIGYVFFVFNSNDRSPRYSRDVLQNVIDNADWLRVDEQSVNDDQQENKVKVPNWSIELPSKDPVRNFSSTQDNGKVLNQVEHAARPGRGMFFVSTAVFFEDGSSLGSDTAKLIQLRDASLQSLGGRLCSSEAGFYKSGDTSYPMLNYLFGSRSDENSSIDPNAQPEDGKSVEQRCEDLSDQLYRGRIVLIGNLSFNFVVGSNVADPPGAQRFFDSLQIN